MKICSTTLLLALCLAVSACSGESQFADESAVDDEVAPTVMDPLARKKQRSDVEDFLDDHARDTVDAINAGQRAISAAPPKSFYLDFKEIRELGTKPNGQLNFVAVLRYCEVTKCHISSKSSEMVVVVPLKEGGYRIVQSKQLGAAGRVVVQDDGTVEATAVEYRPEDPSCCPSAQTISKYKLDGELLRKL